MGRITALVAGALLLVLVGAACGERSEPTGSAATLYPITIPSPSGGKPLVVRKAATRIAVIAPGLQRILTALGAQRDVAGTPVAQNGSLLVSQLRSLRPDLIVASSTSDDQEVGQAARAVPKALVYQAPDDSIDGVEQTITQLGLITGRAGPAERLVRTIENKRAIVDKRLAGTHGVSVFVDTGLFVTVSSQSLIGDMLREVHAQNVAGDSPQVGAFDLGDLARIDPAWYIATSDSGTTLAKLRRDPKTRKLRAVRNGHFATVNVAQLTPSPSIGQGLLDLARLLHPDAFR
ncbi:MAG TPA: ABC transporter substrate-binding protein [Gaiellaceae bacterium]|nr:ABC transporter substrate-binding protein [Gaiellaceae bacterium]